MTEEELEVINEKTRVPLLAKIREVEVEKNLLESEKRIGTLVPQVFKDDPPSSDLEQTLPSEVTNIIADSGSASKLETRLAQIREKQKIVEEKGASKDWQEKDIALKEMEYLFKKCHGVEEDKLLLSNHFLQTCLILLKSCLEENNMTLYL